LFENEDIHIFISLTGVNDLNNYLFVYDGFVVSEQSIVTKKPEENILRSSPPPPQPRSRLLGGEVNQKIFSFSSLKKGGDCPLLPVCSKN
jgi:hypothetical protein